MCLCRFLFAEPTVTVINYLNILQLYLRLKLQKDRKDFIFKQDEAPRPQTSAHLNANLPGRSLGASNIDYSGLHLPPRSPHQPLWFVSYGVTSRKVCKCPNATRFTKAVTKDRGRSRCHPVRSCGVYGRNLITGLTSAELPTVDISSICKVGQKLRMSLPLSLSLCWHAPVCRDLSGYSTAS
jgi:hypothetical protein